MLLFMSVELHTQLLQKVGMVMEINRIRKNTMDRVGQKQLVFHFQSHLRQALGLVVHIVDTKLERVHRMLPYFLVDGNNIKHLDLLEVLILMTDLL